MLLLNTIPHSSEVNEVFQYKRQRFLPKGTNMLGVRGRAAIARHPQSSQAGRQLHRSAVPYVHCMSHGNSPDGQALL